MESQVREGLRMSCCCGPRHTGVLGQRNKEQTSFQTGKKKNIFSELLHGSDDSGRCSYELTVCLGSHICGFLQLIKFKGHTIPKLGCQISETGKPASLSFVWCP